MIKISEERKDFFEMVYAVVRQIPPGRVCSYGAIAAYLGAARSSRMVGWVMNNAHQFTDIPAHRVVNRNGMLTGKMHFETPDTMQQKLEQEGIVIEKDQVVHFKELFWNPAEELKL